MWPISIALEILRLVGEQQDGQVECSDGTVRDVLECEIVGPVGFERGRWARRPSRIWSSVRGREGDFWLRDDHIAKAVSRVVVSRVGCSFLRR